MLYYTEYNNTYDNNDDCIYTFDIETSSILVVNGNVISADKYDELTDADKDGFNRYIVECKYDSR